MKKLITTKRIQVPNARRQEFFLPELTAYDLKDIQAETDDSVVQKLEPAWKKGNFVLVFNKPAGSIVNISFYMIQKEEIEPEKEEPEEKPAVKTPDLKLFTTEKEPEKKPEPLKRKPFFKFIQNIQSDRIELNKNKINEIRSRNLSYPALGGKKILTFDYTGCWARGLGMIAKTIQLQYQLKMPLYRFYDIITGQGDGAIIAAAVAAGIDPEKLSDWWINDWKKVHDPGFVQRSTRWVVSAFKPYHNGYDAGQAGKALRKLFTRSEADFRMKDVLTALRITVMQADMSINTHYSDRNPEIELYTAVEDSAVTKVNYSQRETVKGEAVFLGAVEKNDVIGLCLSVDNKDMSITSIGAPVRVNPPGALKLSKLGDAAMTVAVRSSGHFVHDKRVTALIEKLSQTGYKIGYLRLECKPIDHIVANDTSNTARTAGINSGSGPIDNLASGEQNEKIA